MHCYWLCADWLVCFVCAMHLLCTNIVVYCHLLTPIRYIDSAIWSCVIQQHTRAHIAYLWIFGSRSQNLQIKSHQIELMVAQMLAMVVVHHDALSLTLWLCDADRHLHTMCMSATIITLAPLAWVYIDSSDSKWHNSERTHMDTEPKRNTINSINVGWHDNLIK